MNGDKSENDLSHGIWIMMKVSNDFEHSVFSRKLRSFY